MIYNFGCFQADDKVFRLTADGTAVPLEPKTLRLLFYLIENRGRLLRKQEILDAVWADAAVTENALTRSIGVLRKALQDDSRLPRLIETVPTVGYRFIGDVEIGSADQPSAPKPATGQKSIPTGTSVGRSRRLSALIFIVCCLIVLAGVIGLLILRNRQPPAVRSLAVLPLINLSGDPTQDYFADGMTDELITELARIPNLRIVSRTSVMLDKGAKKSLREIARELNVDAIVEGSTVKSGDRVRITAQLIDSRTDRHLWAESFEGMGSDILSLQDDVSRQIAIQTRQVLLPSTQASSVPPGAYDAYLRGKYFYNKQDLALSIRYFQQAIALDAGYASAYANYATALEASMAFGLAQPEDVMPEALDAARRAIQLDPNNGAAYTELGSIQTIYSWDWAAAERNLLHGISVNPNDSVAEFKFAAYLQAVDRPQEAVTHMRRALRLDPLSFLINRRLGVALYLARDYPDALDQLQRSAEMEQQPATVDNYRSLIYEQQGKYDLAVRHDLLALHQKRPGLDTNFLLTLYQQKGWQSYWRARVGVLLAGPSQACTAYEVGIDYLRLKDFDHAFTALQHAIDRHCIYMSFIRADPLMDPVRRDPRYSTLLARIHQ